MEAIVRAPLLHWLPQVSGIITERDYVCKIALLGKQSKETKVLASRCCKGRSTLRAILRLS